MDGQCCGILCGLLLLPRICSICTETISFVTGIRHPTLSGLLVILGTLTLGCLDPSAIIIGHLAVLFCVVMFASPLAALPTVLETQSAQAIPLAYTAAVLTNSILWTIVGLLDMHDVHIYFPTVLGLGLSGIQLYLKLKFGNGNDINGIGATIVGGSTGFDDTALLFSPVL